ncbi:hypothetical protein [Columbia Basin potato purple top phytoplasma]|uniref:Transmembrane protein n=1 Tax=Columbia Basin potato purple top phytoplasma TaxID=307134 RepID=A0ABT5L8P5_9MOLU|nr:hypothetical protein [Columbia Basin potato purple top phytoplasma]MDC9032002.1 hypothetical protein [Columbia Basin potato purple top phytoplasma]
MKFQYLLEYFKEIFSGKATFLQYFLFVIIILIFIGPILFILFKAIYFIFFIMKCNLDFIKTFVSSNNKSSADNSDSSENPKISINNHSSPDKNNLSLIELKMMEFNQRDNNQIQQNNFLRLEMDQKINQNKMEEKFEILRLEQKMFFLEKEIQRLSNQNDAKNQNSHFSKDDNYDTNDELIRKKIPDYLKQIFEKISDLENVQLLMLNKMMTNNNDNSYYDPDKNVLYVNPKDLDFFKLFLISKNKEKKRLN